MLSNITNISKRKMTKKEATAFGNECCQNDEEEGGKKGKEGRKEEQRGRSKKSECEAGLPSPRPVLFPV